MASKACVHCGVAIRGRAGAQRCRSCAAKTRKPPTLREPLGTCADCGKAISARAPSGCCRSCATARWNRLPETRQKRIEGWKKRMADPEKYAQLCKVAARNSQKAAADPVLLAKAQARGRLMYKLYLDTDEMRDRIRSTRKQAGAKVREHRLGWCAMKYRELHAENVNRHRMNAAQSREMIERLMADDEALRHIESALYFLNRFAPVQVLESGYRYGNAILTPAEIIQRAKVRGWEPERWAA